MALRLELERSGFLLRVAGACVDVYPGHSVTPMAVSVCMTPAAPRPLPIPYPVVASSVEGVGDAAMRTKVNGAASRPWARC